MQRGARRSVHVSVPVQNGRLVRASTDLAVCAIVSRQDLELLKTLDPIRTS